MFADNLTNSVDSTTIYKNIHILFAINYNRHPYENDQIVNNKGDQNQTTIL